MSMIGALSEGLSLIGRSRIASFSWSGSKWLGDNNRSGQCKVFFYYLKACINCKFSRQPFFLSIDGVVVCEEYEQVLLDAWHEEEEQAERRRAEVCLSTLPTSCHIFPFKLFVRIWCFIEINLDVVDKISIRCSLDIESIVREGVDCVFALHILISAEARKTYAGELETFDEVTVNPWKTEEKIQHRGRATFTCQSQSCLISCQLFRDQETRAKRQTD